MAPRARLTVPAVVALGAALLVLAPTLRPGLTLAYDLGWSPDPRLTPFVTGAGMVAPRAVPSDAVGVLLGQVTGAALAQKALLLAIVSACGLAPALLLSRLLPGTGPLALSATALAGIWNPFVAERLAIGQWTILAGLPLSALALAAIVAGRRAPLLAVLAVSGAGGANTVLMVALAALAGLAASPACRSHRWVAPVLLVAGGVSAVWAVPALLARPVPAAGADQGAAVFAARADTPLGVVVSLLSGGGMWNAASHPPSRQMLPLALVATAFAVACAAVVARRAWAPARHGGGVGRGSGGAWAVPVAAGLTGLLLVVLSTLPGTRALWSEASAVLPGGGLLRDSQKLLAPWVVLLAVGAGVLTEWVRARPRQGGAVAAAGLCLLPVAVLPTLAWGVGGKLDAVPVPGDYRRLAATLSDAPTGRVGVLPWNQYRRYPWNDARVSLSLAPRIIDQPVLQNDALPTRSGWVAGEDPRAAQVSAAVAAGGDPVAALRAAGVRYVLIETDAAPPDPRTGGAAAASPLLRDATVLGRGDSGVAYDLGPAQPIADHGPSAWATRAGWAVTLLTWAGLGVLAGARWWRSRGTGAPGDR